MRRKEHELFYGTARWRRVRAVHLIDFPLCALCLALGRQHPAAHVDHKIPVSIGGDPFDPDNLQSLCITCHSAKTAVDGSKGKIGVLKGCTTEGVPVDSAHHWHTSVPPAPTMCDTRTHTDIETNTLPLPHRLSLFEIDVQGVGLNLFGSSLRNDASHFFSKSHNGEGPPFGTESPRALLCVDHKDASAPQ